MPSFALHAVLATVLWASAGSSVLADQIDALGFPSAAWARPGLHVHSPDERDTGGGDQAPSPGVASAESPIVTDGEVDPNGRIHARLGYALGRVKIFASARREKADKDATGPNSDDRIWKPGAGFDVRLTESFSLGAELRPETWDEFDDSITDTSPTTLRAKFDLRF